MYRENANLGLPPVSPASECQTNQSLIANCVVGLQERAMLLWQVRGASPYKGDEQ